MTLSETRKGEWAIVLNELLWSLFPVVTIISYKSLPSFVSLAASVFFACLFFAAVIMHRHRWREVINPAIWPQMLWIICLVGIGYYVFYFWGLTYTSAGNAAIVALMETFFSYLFFNAWRKEEFSGQHIFGTVLMLIGAIIVLFPKGHGLNSGDLLVLIAAAMAPVGNFFQQRVRKKVSSETILFLRALFSLPLMVILAVMFSSHITWLDFRVAMPLLLLNGLIVLGVTKILWIEGIHRISVTKASAFGCLSPLLTLIFAYIFLHQHPLLWQWLALLPMAAGLIMLTYNKSPDLSYQKEAV